MIEEQLELFGNFTKQQENFLDHIRATHMAVMLTKFQPGKNIGQQLQEILQADFS